MALLYSFLLYTHVFTLSIPFSVYELNEGLADIHNDLYEDPEGLGVHIKNSIRLKIVTVIVTHDNGIGTARISSYLNNIIGCIPLIVNTTSNNWDQSASVQYSTELLIVCGSGVIKGYQTEVRLLLFY